MVCGRLQSKKTLQLIFVSSCGLQISNYLPRKSCPWSGMVMKYVGKAFSSHPCRCCAYFNKVSFTLTLIDWLCWLQQWEGLGIAHRYRPASASSSEKPLSHPKSSCPNLDKNLITSGLYLTDNVTVICVHLQVFKWRSINKHPTEILCSSVPEFDETDMQRWFQSSI